MPQIGWNRVRWIQEAAGYHPAEEDDFYFVHSYVIEPDDPADIVASPATARSSPASSATVMSGARSFTPRKADRRG